jgi:predicted O-linked N-acetylglucosamine transferase (SPINDLY family)
MALDPAPLLAQAQALHNAGQAVMAEPLYQQIIGHCPQTPEAAKSLTNLGVIRQGEGRLDEALVLHGQALALAPLLAEAWCNRGDAYSDLNRLDEAEADFRRAAQLAPGLVPAWFNLGNVLLRLNRMAEAEASYGQAIALMPHLAATAAWALSDAGARQQQAGRIVEAKETLGRAIALCPGLAAAHYNLGNAFYGEGRAAEAADHYRHAWELDPSLTQASSNYLNCLHYLPDLDGAELASRHREMAPSPLAILPHANAPDPARALRIGYLSADFCRHPLGQLMLPVLAAHDPESVFAICYSSRHGGDEVTEALRARSALWREVADLDDGALERLIRADGVDILVDLDGHTGGNRLGVFARKPAPIQVSWLGYPFTTGLTTMDYALLDRATVPVEAEPWFSETVHCLPVSRLCYQGPDAPLPAPPPMIARGHVTFGSFNNIAKLGPAVVAAWSSILHAVPGSRLLLKWPHLAQAETAARLLGAFQAHGIDAARIELRGNSPPAQLLAEYGDMDIALDPFPYCGAFTSCEALWMGVPVVTLPGPRPFSRQTLALITALGLDDQLAARDLAEYHVLAVTLANDLDRLTRLRAELRPAMCRNLGDASRLVPALESFYRRAWEKWCGGN